MKKRNAVLTAIGTAGLLLAGVRMHAALAVVTESLSLTKTASADVISPGQPVTYTYVVQNNGSETLSDLRVVDDDGTPDDASDDFVAGTADTLAPGEVRTFTVTRYPDVGLCVDDGSGSDMDAGSLTAETLSDGNILIRFNQSRDIVDNTYGANASAGWTKGHKFSQLVGSDHAEFKLRDGAGDVVIYFAADYISQSSAYPSGYGTLGVTGGDGKVFIGNASDVLSVKTSITDDLNQSPAFYGYTTDSPKEPNPAWDYVDSYTVVVRGSLFQAHGFGSVEIPYVHNSPAKTGQGQISPTPCDTEVTNVATARATFTDSGGTTVVVNAADSATVLVTNNTGGGGASDVVVGTTSVAAKTMSVTLTNQGGATATIEKMSLNWPSSNKALVKIQIGAATIYDTKTNAGPATFTKWKGHVQDRQIKAGGTVTLKLTFEANAATSASLYSLGCDFGSGMVTLVP